MNLVLHNILLRPHQKESSLVSICEKKLRAPCAYMRILKKSLDARDKADIKWVYSLECSDREQPRMPRTYEKINKTPPRVYIAGAGPAGLFCALRLVRRGIFPVILERGKRVEERAEDVARFFGSGALDPESNVQFGEGGAGTFSDGKLNTQTNNPLNHEVLEDFVAFGAPAEVGYLAKPHVGSDKLRAVVANIRNYMISRGGEIRYGAKLTDVHFRDGKLCGVSVNGAREDADELVLAVGHSARDTFEMLLSRGFHMEQKEFAVGVRVEHLQAEIGRAQYGSGYAALPAADYKLVSHAHERAVFTFCMCPGGVVVPSASEEGGVVVNGMSDFARGGRNANSALVVQVKKEDFGGDSPLAGIEYQRKIERAAYLAAGGGYRAPVQLAGDFLAGKESYYFGSVQPTYARGTAFAPVNAYLPAPLCEALRLAIPDMGRKLWGFDCFDAVLTGVESRTSSPLRVMRESDMQAAGFRGVYPCGEGCGYAGGITSAATDGIRAADALANKYM